MFEITCLLAADRSYYIVLEWFSEQNLRTHLRFEMFEGFLKPRFVTKCKGALKPTKMRIDAIRKKRRAVEKFLKNDIAELLRTGLDYNAYGRAEGLLIERDRTACYDLIDQYCNDVLKTMPVMQKQFRECPEECREAVGSLIYSAARLADLPELRELRTLFTGKYGKSIEPFASKELVRKLKGEHPSKEQKLQLMHDIAQESGIDWDSKALEQRLFRPPPVVSRQVHGRQQEPVPLKYSMDNREVDDANLTNVTTNNHRRCCSNDKESNEASHELAHMTSSTSTGSASEEDALDGKLSGYGLVPPPYLRNKARASSTENALVAETRPRPRSVRRRNSKLNIEPERTDQRAEEEKAIDDLLMYYSSKESSSASPKHPSIQKAVNGINGVVPPERMQSFPAEQVSTAEAARGHLRAASLQPEMLARHVHPRMPEYDDLAARLAALRG